MRNPYNKSGDILILINEDSTGRKISKNKANIQDEEEVMRIIKSMIQKYGLNLDIIKKQNTSMDWLKADEEFKW